ncbi:unnamed protein product [Rhizophagus irregularis]|nr:unnamed protein product [Rhizophagus irregularis]CAB5362313.1 unnamed protein product [Rhizophagus irregularis]
MWKFSQLSAKIIEMSDKASIISLNCLIPGEEAEADSVVILGLKNDKGAILSGEKGINVIVYSPVVLEENPQDTGL